MLVAVLIILICFFSQIPISGGYNPNTRQRTAIIDTTLMPHTDIINRLSGWKIVASGKKPVDFIFGFSDISKQYYNTPAVLRFNLDAGAITDKTNLHYHMSKFAPDLIAKTTEINAETTMPPGAIWVVRANWGWAGKANGTAHNTEELQELYKTLSKPVYEGRKRDIKIIGSEYIQNPMLWRGYKFHVRVYILAVVREHARYAIMLKTIRTVAASKPYINADFHNMEIHDTHFSRNPEFEYITQNNPLYAAIIAAMRRTFKHMLPLAKAFPESKNAYEIFGVDIMFSRSGMPIILEINTSPRMSGDTDFAKKIRAEAIDAIFTSVFADVFGVRGKVSGLLL